MSRGIVPVELLLATSAKVLCSAIFVSGRDESEALRNSVFHALQVHHLSGPIARHARASVDRQARMARIDMHVDESVARELLDAWRALHPTFDADWSAEIARLVSLGTVARSARFVGDQGSLIVPREGGEPRFAPQALRSALPPGSALAWPMGDGPDSSAAPRSSADRAAIARALDAAFADDDARTVAIVVVHRGEIVGERYREGYGIDTQFESWSMGKSIAATLVGVLVRMGRLQLEQPAPIAAWREPDDPRASITIRHLLNMSSGLHCPGIDDPPERWGHALPDHFYVYGEALDSRAFAIDRPARFAPGTVGRYRNCDTLALAAIVRDVVVRELGENPLAWPQAALFDRIGIRRQVLETDWFGNFLITGFDYGTARNWARLGLLYLQDGVWQGERVLPEGWCDFVRTPAPGWPEGNYGGQFWLNTRGEFALPKDAYSMYGAGEQRVFIVPSAELVIVRMGHQRGYEHAKKSVDTMAAAVLEAVSGARGGNAASAPPQPRPR